jgi:hypothetical protein
VAKVGTSNPDGKISLEVCSAQLKIIIIIIIIIYLRLTVYSEDGGNTYLRNVGTFLPEYSNPRLNRE